MAGQSSEQSRGRSAASGARRWLRTLRNVGFALVPLAALLAVSEGVLTLAGLGDPAAGGSLTRGFSPLARYLVPDDERPGWWRTQMHDGQLPEVEIPPKGGRTRVIMIGGSNVQGFPTPKLSKALNWAMPEPGFEVINLGRRGYGSERCRILLDQALALQPDIVFIYMGHNEFVERGFALELLEVWKSPLLARVADRLSRLRTLNVLVSLLERAPDDATALRRAEPWRQHPPRQFEGFTYDDTLFVYDAYRANLKAMCLAAQAQGARVLISTVVGNMLFPPTEAGEPGGPPARKDRRLWEREKVALALVPTRLREHLIPSRPEAAEIRLTPDDWGVMLTDAEREAKLAGAAAPEPPPLRELGPPFGGGPFWTDPKLWSPSVRPLLETLSAVHLRQLAEDEHRDVEEALRLLDEAQAEAPRDPWLLYERGLCAYLLGDDGQANRLLRDSSRYDLVPWRGNDATNDIVREVAAELSGVLLVDAETQVCAACPSGLVGYELMVDNCHFHNRAQPALMSVFVPGLLELARR
jgi:hypothetical protein